MAMLNKLIPGIKGKAFDPDWFLLRQRLEEVDAKIGKCPTCEHKDQKIIELASVLKTILKRYKIEASDYYTAEEAIEIEAAIGTNKARKQVRQAIDEARPSIQEERISAMGSGVTVCQLKKMLEQLDIPDNAKIKFAIGQPEPGWALLESVSFCRPENEVSLW